MVGPVSGSGNTPPSQNQNVTYNSQIASIQGAISQGDITSANKQISSLIQQLKAINPPNTSAINSLSAAQGDLNKGTPTGISAAQVSVNMAGMQLKGWNG